MRVRIVLNLVNKRIPVNYRSILSGIIYAILPSNEATAILHNQGSMLGKRKFKLMTFSEIYGDCSYDLATKSLLFHSSGCFDVTSFHEQVVLDIVNYIEENAFVIFGNQIIEILKYDILNDYCSNNDIETFYTVSPITIYKTQNKYVQYFSPDDEEFKNGIIQNLNQKYFLCYRENMSNVEIMSINKVTKKKVFFRKTLYEAYHLTITFQNLTPKVQKVILTTGLGPKNALGFGMVSKK